AAPPANSLPSLVLVLFQTWPITPAPWDSRHLALYMLTSSESQVHVRVAVRVAQVRARASKIRPQNVLLLVNPCGLQRWMLHTPVVHRAKTKRMARRSSSLMPRRR